ncbi:MAG: histone deacetylase, partial [Desulfobacteria bacterium]
CGREYESPDRTKVDVGFPDLRGNVSGRPINDAYFDRVAHQFPDRVRRFRPDLIFWYFGFDTHQGDYGDIGLTGPCYWNIACLMRDLAGEVCGGKLAVVLGGGSKTKLATYLIPPIIERLAGS